MSVKYTFLTLFLINIISKILGFIRESVLAYFYGTSSMVDIYLLATSIPTIIFGCIDAIAIAITPGYIKAKVEGDDKANKVVAITLSLLVVITSITCLIFEIFIDNLLMPYSSSLSEIEKEQLVLFTRITVLVVMFNPITQCLLSLLRCKDKQESAAITELLISGIQIVFIAISGIWYNSILLPVGYSTSHLSCMIIAIILASKGGIVWKFNLKKISIVKDIFLNTFPIFISSTIVQINAFIDKSFAATLPTGAISSLGYANTLKNLIYSLFTVMIINVFYPKVSESIVNNKIIEAKKTMKQCLLGLSLFLAPIIVFSYVYAEKIIGVIYERGSFDNISTEITVAPFRMYILGIFAISIRDIVMRYYYSLGIKKRVVVFSGITIFINIILNIMFIDYFSQAGLALATSISAMIGAILYLFFLPSDKKLEMNNIIKDILIYFGIAIVSGVVSNVPLKNIWQKSDTKFIMSFLNLIIALVSVIGIYIIIVFTLYKIKIIKLPFKLKRMESDDENIGSNPSTCRVKRNTK